MKHIQLNVFLAFLFFIIPLQVYAGGSSYSRYGFGDIIRYGDSRLYAMAGTGIALVDDGFINELNPAGLSRISLTRFSGGFEFDHFNTQDPHGSSIYSTGGIQGLALAIPISKENGIVMSLEATPYSAVHYAISDTTSDITPYSKQQTFYGSGGLTSLGIGLSGSPLNTLHIGGRLNYLFGRTRQYQMTTYNSASGYASTTLDHSLFYSGFTFTLGTIYEGLDELLHAPSLHNLAIGLTVTTGTTLDVEQQDVYSSVDSTFSTSGTADIPFSIGVGLSYFFQERYRLLGDLVLENWGSAKTFETNPSAYRNSIRASIGFESSSVKNPDSFWKRIAYRAGLAYNASYYSISGAGIDEFIIGGGLGLPMGPEARLNIGLQVGLRSSSDKNLPKDTIFRLSVGISASEVWFMKFDEE